MATIDKTTNISSTELTTENEELNNIDNDFIDNEDIDNQEEEEEEEEEEDNDDEDEEIEEAASDNDNVDEDDKDDTCLYNLTKTKIDDDENNDINNDELHFEDDDIIIDTVIESHERQAKPYLTKFEKVRVLGVRATQIAYGAKSMILNTAGMNAKEIAKMELTMKKMPLKIEKILPNGKREIWSVNELKILN